MFGGQIARSRAAVTVMAMENRTTEAQSTIDTLAFLVLVATCIVGALTWVDITPVWSPFVLVLAAIGLWIASILARRR